THAAAVALHVAVRISRERAAVVAARGAGGGAEVAPVARLGAVPDAVAAPAGAGQEVGLTVRPAAEVALVVAQRRAARAAEVGALAPLAVEGIDDPVAATLRP